MKFARSFFLIALGTSCIGLSGCGKSDGPPEPAGPKASVKGKVLFEAKPVTQGTLVLDSGKGFAVTAPVSQDGSFTLKGTNGAEFPAGTYTVGITPPPPTQQAVGSATMAPRPAIEGIPPRFYAAATSGVKVEIAPGKKEDLVIELR